MASGPWARPAGPILLDGSGPQRLDDCKAKQGDTKNRGQFLTRWHNVLIYYCNRTKQQLKTKKFQKFPTTESNNWKPKKLIWVALHSLLLCWRAVACARHHEQKFGTNRTYNICMWREQATIEWAQHVISVVVCCHSLWSFVDFTPGVSPTATAVGMSAI